MSMEQRTTLDHVLFSVGEEEYERVSLEQLRDLAGWLSEFGVSHVTLDVRGCSAEEEAITFGDVECEVVPYGGRGEIVGAVRSLAVEADEGDLDPGGLEESDLEERLPLDRDVDLVVKTGEPRLVDSAIYRTVYSEVRFVDSWSELDRETVDGIAEDFEETDRRYGR